MGNDLMENDNQVIEKLKEMLRKDDEILKFYERWIRLKNSNEGIFTFLQNNAFEKVAVYGMGSLGRSLCSELESRDIKIAYIIEQNEHRRNANYTFYTIQDELPEVDVILITPITLYEEIAEELAKKVKCPLLSLDDIVP